MQVNPISQLYSDFVAILNGVVVKFKSEADKYETLDSKKASDGYITAYLKEDKFETYYRYERSVIAEVLTLTEDRDIDTFYYNRNLIPIEYRELMLIKQRQYILDNYVEENNYYRMLQGLPDIAENELNYFYLEEDIANKYLLPTDIPLHEFDNTQIDVLSSIGYLDTLIENNPTKKYLKYLGNNSIDIVTARRAKNFALIRVPQDITESLLNLFRLLYDQCREYFMVCIYITEYRNTIDYYDNFIALCIMVMTWQQVMARTIKKTIERDFFDPYCCKLLFSVYNVPFYSEMDSTTRGQLVQNLNLLVKNKGTNKVIYDIASILGYDRLEIFKYYIVKNQKFDANGLPIKATTIDPETGETVPDYKAMFDVYFQKVSVEDTDGYDAVVNAADKQTYMEVTEDDPYWIDDTALQKELYESEYNFVESKYMGIGISYRMTKLIFENIYLLKLLLEKKDQIPYIQVNIPKLSKYDSISLFDAIVVLCAMVCKQNRLKGEILTSPSKILHVLGFTFNEDWEIIHADVVETQKCKADILGINTSKSSLEYKEMIEADPYLDNELCNFFMDSALYTAESINKLYNSYVGLYDALVAKMSTTNDINVYHAYRKLYQTLFFTKENSTMFNIGTDESPVYANTYMEYIEHTLPDIYEFINNTGPDDMYSNVNYLVSRILRVIPDLRYLGFFDGHSNTMERMLLELIRFFKSYTTDLISMNIIYIFDMKPETLLRLIEHISIHNNIIPRDYWNISYSDHLSFTSTVRYQSNLDLLDKAFYIHKGMNMFDTCKFMDALKLHTSITPKDITGYYDVITGIFEELSMKDESFKFDSTASVHSIATCSDVHGNDITFREYIGASIDIMLRCGLSFYESANIANHIFIKCGGRLNFHDTVSQFINRVKTKTSMEFHDKCNITHASIITHVIESLTDVVGTIYKSMTCEGSIGFKDKCFIYLSD